MKAIENIAYSGWRADGGFEEFEENNVRFRNTKAPEVLEEFVGHQGQ